MDGGLLSLKWNNHRSSFIHMLSSLRKKDTYCDVTLACDGKFYSSHKLVLSTCSEYFQEMFQRTDCKHPIIVLKDMRSEDLESLLNYMYVGEVNILQEHLSTLIKAAECLKIKGLAVPDDPPGDKRSNNSDFNPDSKRRKMDSDYHKQKDTSRSQSHKSAKSPDRLYKSGACSSSDDAFTSQKEQFTCDSQNYGYNSQHNVADNFGSDTTTINKEKELAGESVFMKEEEPPLFIKQEPSDNVIDLEVEDSKEGILQSSHAAFTDTLSQVDSSKPDNVESSDTQNIWGSESQSSDSYPPYDGDNPVSVNEKDGQNESVHIKRILKSGSNEYGNLSSIQCSDAALLMEEQTSGACSTFSFLKDSQEMSSAMDYRKEDYVDEVGISKPFPLGGRRYSLPDNSLSNSVATTQEPYVPNDSSSASYPSSQELELRPTFSCTMCSYVGYHKCNLIKHLVIHSGTKPFSCPHCSFTSAQKGNVKTHMKKKHPFLPFVKL